MSFWPAVPPSNIPQWDGAEKDARGRVDLDIFHTASERRFYVWLPEASTTILETARGEIDFELLSVVIVKSATLFNSRVITSVTTFENAASKAAHFLAL